MVRLFTSPSEPNGAPGSGVAEGAPAPGEQREPALAQAAQRALEGVAGAGVDIEFLVVGAV